MRVGEIIEYVDTVEPNIYDTTVKINWLADLDREIFDNVVLTHACPDVDTGKWTAPAALDDELIIPEPYARDAYEYYLRAKIAASNMEDERYNQHTVMFNGAYQKFWRWYNRRHRPLAACGGNRFRF